MYLRIEESISWRKNKRQISGASKLQKWYRKNDSIYI